jgi:hypothetical protein
MIDNKTIFLLVILAVLFALAYDKAKFKSRGVGDSFGHAFEYLGIKRYPGCGCAERHKWLNKLVPYSK